MTTTGNGMVGASRPSEHARPSLDRAQVSSPTHRAPPARQARPIVFHEGAGDLVEFRATKHHRVAAGQETVRQARERGVADENLHCLRFGHDLQCFERRIVELLAPTVTFGSSGPPVTRFFVGRVSLGGEKLMKAVTLTLELPIQLVKILPLPPALKLREFALGAQVGTEPGNRETQSLLSLQGWELLLKQLDQHLFTGLDSQPLGDPPKCSILPLHDRVLVVRFVSHPAESE